MLGLIFLYFIGKYFYKLSEKFNKNKWLYAVLGVVVYYAGTMIGGVILALSDEFLDIGFNWDNDLLLAILVLPFGLGATYLFYFSIEKKWQRTDLVVKDEIKDIGRPIE